MYNEMNKSDIIMIIYETSCTVPYLCISGFFSFCGFLVMGIPAEETDSLPISHEYVTVFLSCDEITNKQDSVIYLKIESDNRIGYAAVGSLLDKMRYGGYIDEQITESLNEIRSVYKYHDLRLHEYNLQHYFCIKDEIPEIINIYLKASNQLYDIVGKRDDNPYLEHAFYHCMRRIEALSRYNNKTGYVKQDMVINNIDRCISKYPEFGSFRALKGYLYSLMSAKKEAIDTLTEYSDDIVKCSYLNRYTSEILYTIGRLYEYAIGDDFNARAFYSFSASKNKYNIRPQYKMARFYQNRGMLKDAWFIYSFIEKQLDGIADQKFLQPRESEYLFKVLFCKYRISYGKNYESQRSALTEKILKVSREDIDSQVFYDEFYINESGKYKKLVMERLKLQLSKLN